MYVGNIYNIQLVVVGKVTDVIMLCKNTDVIIMITLGGWFSGFETSCDNEVLDSSFLINNSLELS
jgi:hypothetical protein